MKPDSPCETAGVPRLTVLLRHVIAQPFFESRLKRHTPTNSGRGTPPRRMRPASAFCHRATPERAATRRDFWRTTTSSSRFGLRRGSRFYAPPRPRGPRQGLRGDLDQQAESERIPFEAHSDLAVESAHRSRDAKVPARVDEMIPAREASTGSKPTQCRFSTMESGAIVFCGVQLSTFVPIVIRRKGPSLSHRSIELPPSCSRLEQVF